MDKRVILLAIAAGVRLTIPTLSTHVPYGWEEMIYMQKDGHSFPYCTMFIQGLHVLIRYHPHRLSGLFLMGDPELIDKIAGAVDKHFTEYWSKQI